MYDDVYKRFAKNFAIYDGDSFRADLDLGDYRWELGRPFRLYGLDTPELAPRWSYYTNDDGTRDTAARDAEKAAAIEARDRAKAYVSAAVDVIVIQTVKLPGKPVRDKYGRTLCKVWIPLAAGMASLAERLIAERHARPYDGGTKQRWSLLRPLGQADPIPA